MPKCKSLALKHTSGRGMILQPEELAKSATDLTGIDDDLPCTLIAIPRGDLFHRIWKDMQKPSVTSYDLARIDGGSWSDYFVNASSDPRK